MNEFMDVANQLLELRKTNDLVFILFYADWSPHYKWLNPAIRAFEHRVVKLVKVNIATDKAIADAFHIGSVPAFVLMHGEKEMWRQIGELTVDELREMLDDFR